MLPPQKRASDRTWQCDRWPSEHVFRCPPIKIVHWATNRRARNVKGKFEDITSGEEVNKPKRKYEALIKRLKNLHQDFEKHDASEFSPDVAQNFQLSA